MEIEFVWTIATGLLYSSRFHARAIATSKVHAANLRGSLSPARFCPLSPNRGAIFLPGHTLVVGGVFGWGRFREISHCLPLGGKCDRSSPRRSPCSHFPPLRCPRTSAAGCRYSFDAVCGKLGNSKRRSPNRLTSFSIKLRRLKSLQSVRLWNPIPMDGKITPEE